MRKILAAGLLVLGVQAHAAKYVLDKGHFNVGFNIKHLVISTVHGRFDKYEGDFDFDPKTGALNAVNAKIDVASINTNDADRDKHLKNEDFFGVTNKDGKAIKFKKEDEEKFKYITFKSTKVENKSGKPSKVYGDLTMKGVTKPVILTVDYKGATSDPWGNQKVVFTATTKIVRKDFGLTYNKALETGGVVIGEDVNVVLEGEANLAK